MLFAGGMAGTASWVLTYPLDVIKSRLQADVSGKYSCAMDCFRKSVVSEGYTCLIKGLNSTIIRAFPTNAATFAVVTWTFRIFNYQPQVEESPAALNRVVPAAETYTKQWSVILSNLTNEEFQLSRSYYSTISTSLVNFSIKDDKFANQNLQNDKDINETEKEDVEDEWAPESRYNEFRIAVTS